MLSLITPVIISFKKSGKRYFFVIDLSQLTFIFASSHISNTFCEFLKVSLKRSLYKYVKKFDLKRIKENIQNGGQL